MSIGNKVSLCIVGNIADGEGMVMEEKDVIDDLTVWEYVCDKGGAINFRASNFPFWSKFGIGGMRL
ncbi:UNVERIFIED_CONTAM: hypothetical protein NCL1_15794 [Trichonephila clavipes]